MKKTLPAPSESRPVVRSRASLPHLRIAARGSHAVQPQALAASLWVACLVVGLLCLPSSCPAANRVIAWGDNSQGQTNVPSILSNVVAVAAGWQHSMALRSNGTVIVWGSQTNLPGLTSVRAIDAGREHSVAMKANGTVVAWGVGNNAPSVTNLPAGFSNVAAIASGDYHILALKSNGTVIAWPSSVQPTGLVNVAAIAAGGYHSLAIRSNGRVVAWGNNDYGQTNVPAGLAQSVALAGGNYHSLALKADGTVAAWGMTNFGATDVPSGLSNVVGVAGGDMFSLALKNDGTVVRWGEHPWITIPVTPPGLSNVTAISAGGSHVVAVLGDGAPAFAQRLVSRSYYSGSDVVLFPGAVGTPPLTYQWQRNGSNLDGATNATLILSNLQTNQAGIYSVIVSNSRGTNSQTATVSVVASRPVILSQPWPATNFLGGTTTLTAEADGTQPLRYQWLIDGAEISGATNAVLVLSNLALADTGNYSLRVSNSQGTTDSSAARVLVSPVFVWGGQTFVPDDLTNLVAISAGIQYNPSDPPTHQLGLRADGTVVAWGGTNTYGQNDVPAGLSNVIGVAGGGTYSLALKADGTVVAWGGSAPAITNIPAGLNQVVGIAAGSSHSIALKANGEVVPWGFIASGPPPEATNVIAIAAGPSFSLALRKDGRVIGWGENSFGQASPPPMNDAVAIAAGGAHGLALEANGRVAAWGAFYFGAIAVPLDLSNVVAIAAGGRNSYALKSDGTLVSWGEGAGVPAGLHNVVAIAAGGEYSVALIGDGSPRFYNLRPEQRVVFAGRNTAFSVMAAGASPLRYQWRRDGIAIPDATNALLTLSNVLTTDAGVYSIVLSNASGVTATNVASLTVFTNFLILAQPQSRQLPPGFPVSFSVVADGAGPFQYGWRFNGAPIGDATNAVLTLPGVGPGNVGSYTVEITNPYGLSITSVPATLSLLPFTATGSLVADFETGLPAGASVSGSAAADHGVLKLMADSADYGWGALLVDDFSRGAPVTAFVASFDVLLTDGIDFSGQPAPLYGFSFNFATNFPDIVGEEGSSAGLSVGFDNYYDGSPDTAPAIEAKIGGRLVAAQPTAGGYASGNPPAIPYVLDPRTGQPLTLETEPANGQGPRTNYAHVTIELKVDGALWVTFKDLLVLSNVQTALPPMRGGKFLISAGNPSQNVWIDNLKIQTFNEPVFTDIAVEQPPGTGLVNGASGVDFGAEPVGGSVSRTFIIKCVGRADLTGLGVTVSGSNADEFAVTADPAGPVPYGGHTKLTVTFTPRTTAAKSAVLHIASNDPDESPFDIALNGLGEPPEAIVQQAYLKAANPVYNSNFGGAVAASGNTVVIGAANQNYPDAPQTGAAYVFVREGTTWTMQAYLRPSDADPYNARGDSVAISGDTIVVGMPYSRSSGAANVFVRHGTNWSHEARLQASNAEADDRFGWSVAASGNTIVIGAPFEDSNARGVNGDQANNSADYAGAAYVFVRNGTNWSQQAYLKASNTGMYHNFGGSVAVSGDTAVVGAAGEASSAGASYVFVRSGTNWTQQAYLKASNAESADNFGRSVAASGDSVVVGAMFESSNATGINGAQNNNSAPSSGAAYVFARTGTNWVQQAYLKASNTEAYDYFGASVSVSGDTVVLGAYQEASSAKGVNGQQNDNSAPGSGAAYVFQRNGTHWTQQAYLKASNAESPDAFGWSVAASGDVVVVGAVSEFGGARGVNGDQTDNSVLYAGAAYVFSSILTGPRLLFAPDGVGGYFIRFHGVPDLTYQLQRAPTVNGPWDPIATNTASASGMVEFHELTPPSDQAFYRARLVR